MMPTGAATPPASSAMPPSAGGNNQALINFRKALGASGNQPADEMKVIQACMGQLGPEVKQMAIAVAKSGAGALPSPDAGGDDEMGDQPIGGTPAPAEKVGAAEMFGRKPMPSDPEADSEEERPTARHMFGRGGR